MLCVQAETQISLPVLDLCLQRYSVREHQGAGESRHPTLIRGRALFDLDDDGRRGRPRLGVSPTSTPSARLDELPGYKESTVNGDIGNTGIKAYLGRQATPGRYVSDFTPRTQRS